MKEWCMKHPFLTFLLIDELLTFAYNAISDRKRQTTANKVLQDVETRVEYLASKKQEKSAEDSKQPIGFKVS